MKRGFLNKKTKNTTSGGNAVDASTEQEDEKDLVAMMNKLFHTGGTVVDLDLGRLGINMPIGKIDTTVPEHYVPKERKIKIDNGLDTDYDDCDFVFSTIPLRPVNVDIPAVGPDTWAECLFRGGKQKRAILSIPDFPKSVPESPETRYLVGPSTHGLGMFATKDLVPNDFILAERPLLVIPAMIDLQLDFHSDNFKLSPAQRTQAHLAEVEKILQVCIDRMDPQDRQAFFELHDCHTGDGSGPIFGRVRTNGIEFNIDKTGEEDKELFHNSGTFQIISRINHSCTPNVTHFFEQPSFSLRLHAIRPIKAGEELFFSYIDIDQPTAKRQEKLRPYGFKCACDACTDPTWDVRLSCIVKSVKQPPTGPPEGVINDSLRWIKIIEEAKLERLSAYFHHLTRVVMISTMVGRRNFVKEYDAKCKAWISAMHDESIMTLFEKLI